ncbi:MAG: DUF2630 family protein [Acidobacteriota bacterium]
MSDHNILRHIHELVDEEKDLLGHDADLSDDQRARRQAIESELDECWHLLRQRRARRTIASAPTDDGAPSTGSAGTSQR